MYDIVLFELWRRNFYKMAVQITWQECRLAYRRFCDLNDFHPAINPVPAFLEFVGIPYSYASISKHGEDDITQISDQSVARIRALTSPHYKTLYKAMQQLPLPEVTDAQGN